MSAGRDEAGFGACSAEAGCLTCGDVAVPLTVVAVDGADARCRDEAGRGETVAVELVGPVGVGDRLLVHAGVAIELLAPASDPVAGPVADQVGDPMAGERADAAARPVTEV